LTLIVAHRGDRAHAAENTLHAFESALSKGAEMIEMDLQLSADGRVVVFHDLRLDELTSSHGTVREHTLAELRTLAVRPERFTHHEDRCIPTLDEVLERIGDRCPLYLELKRAADDGTALAMAVLEIVGRDTPHVLASFDEELVLLCRKAGRSTALIANDARAAILAADRIGGLEALSLRLGEWSEQVLAEVTARSMRAWAWTVNDRRDWWRLQQLRVHAICTDDPGAARGWREETP